MRGHRNGRLPERVAVPGHDLIACGGMWVRLGLSVVKRHHVQMPFAQTSEGVGVTAFSDCERCVYILAPQHTSAQCHLQIHTLIMFIYSERLFTLVLHYLPLPSLL